MGHRLREMEFILRTFREKRREKKEHSLIVICPKVCVQCKFPKKKGILRCGISPRGIVIGNREGALRKLKKERGRPFSKEFVGLKHKQAWQSSTYTIVRDLPKALNESPH